MNLDLTSKGVIKSLLKEKEVYPSKKMGQNFLIQRNALQQLIRTAEIEKENIVLEIGPGLGTITKELARRAKKVIAVEKDRKLVEILKENLKDFANVEIIQADVLKLKVKNLKLNKNLKLKIKNYKIVSNLPYNIATEVIRRFLEEKSPPKLMALIVQKEVGERICSRPPRMSRLGVLIQFKADVKIIKTLKKDCFWPKPKIDSVILKAIPKKTISISARSHRFVDIVKAGFSQPRKQLINNFSKGLGIPRGKIERWLKKNGIDPSQRAESLSLEDWINLTKSYNEF